MKTLKLTTAILLLTFLQTALFAGEYVRKTEKTWEVKPGDLLELKNSYGTIECVPSPDNRVSVRVEITVHAGSEEKAEKAFGQVSTELEHLGNKVSVVTTFKKKSFLKNVEVTVDYYVSLPQWLNLDIDHQFGDLALTKMSGNVKIDLDYGDFEIRGLTGNRNELSFSFSDGTIGFLSSGNVKLRYSELEVAEGGDLNINSKFSDWESEKIDTAVIESGYDDISINRIEYLDLTGNFSDVTLQQVGSGLVAGLDYGSLIIRELSPDFKNVLVRSRFGEAEISVSPQSAFRLSASVSMGDFDYPGRNSSVKSYETSATSEMFEGVIGEGDPADREITLVISNGDAVISYK
ncbi:MAG: hypothetical protein Kow00127_09420 [Bacteroidales bacterium]